jgi:hypothetical protein
VIELECVGEELLLLEAGVEHRLMYRRLRPGLLGLCARALAVVSSERDDTRVVRLSSRTSNAAEIAASADLEGVNRY